MNKAPRRRYNGVFITIVLLCPQQYKMLISTIGNTVTVNYMTMHALHGSVHNVYVRRSASLVPSYIELKLIDTETNGLFGLR